MALINRSTGVYLKLTINDKELVTDWTNLVYFKMTEYSGLALTYFEGCFRTFNKEIADLVIVNNKIVAVVGNDENSADTFTINIAKENKDNGGVFNQYMVTFSGVTGNTKYLVDTKSEFYIGTSIEVIKQFYNLYLKNDITDNIVSDIDDVNETPMTWFRTNQAGNMFLADVWLHMNIYPSFPLLAIDKYNNLIMKDYLKLQMSEPKWTFTASNKLANYQAGDMVFLNNFNVKSYKEASNMYSGYGKFVSISNSDSGNYSIFNSDNSTSLLSNSQATENNNYGTKLVGATVNSGNVYNSYQQSYFYNTSKLVDLSSYEGMLHLSGGYHKELKPLDLVNIKAGTTYTNIEGKYIIDTIEYAIFPNQAFQTKVYVCRDNLNDLENSLDPEVLKNFLLVPSNEKGKLLQYIRNLRTYVSFARNLVNGMFLNSVIAFAKELKYNLLSNFNIYGTNINLNSRYEALNSLINLANNIGNRIIDGVIPSPYNLAFHDILLRRPTSIGNVLSTLSSYLAPDLQEIISNIFSLMAETSSLLQYIKSKNSNRIQQQNISTVKYKNNQVVQFNETAEDGITQITITEDNTNMINDIKAQQVVSDTITSIEQNTSGTDIPIPIIDLTESQTLLSEEQLQQLVVNTVVQNLQDRGYLDNFNDQQIQDNIVQPLLDNKHLDGNTIQVLNNSISKTLYTRFWGTFDSLIELTNFYVENSFKDVYRTIGTTKLVNATGGKRIFIAVPVSQVSSKLRFYINNVNVTNQIGVNVDTDEHPALEMYLNILDKAGQMTKYRVFYTDTQYNSNSVVVEIRQI